MRLVDTIQEVMMGISPTETPLLRALGSTRVSNPRNGLHDWAGGGFNIVQHFETKVFVSSLAEKIASDDDRGKEFSHQTAKKLRELKRDLEFTFSGAQAANPVHAPLADRRAAGLEVYCRRAVSRGLWGSHPHAPSSAPGRGHPRPLTEELLLDVLDRCPEASLLIVPRLQRLVFSRFEGFREVEGYTRNDQHLVVGFSAFCRQSSILVLCPEDWKLAWQTLVEFEKVHPDQGVLRCAVTLEGSDQGSGILTDLEIPS